MVELSEVWTKEHLTELVKDESKFLEWLKSHGENDGVGYIFSAVNNPVCKWLESVGYMNVSIDEGGIYARHVNAVPVPEWVLRYLMFLDDIDLYVFLGDRYPENDDEDEEFNEAISLAQNTPLKASIAIKELDTCMKYLAYLKTIEAKKAAS